MTGLDTNVVVRFFVEDDPAQFRRVGTLFETFTVREPGFISLVAIAEFAWVLRAQYRISRTDLTACLRRLATAPELVLENHDAVLEAIDGFAEGKSDFADYLIQYAGHRAGCRRTLTFDVAAAKATGMHLLK